MVFIGLVLLGLISFSRLPQELFPPITYPQLTVVTTYKDAAPEEIELLVTKPLEETVGTVSGLKRISSISKEEVSLITAEFNWGTNMDFAALGVREKIDLVKERLPRGCEEPVVIKYNPFDLPVMVLNITSELPATELMQFTRKVIKNELEKTEGVAAVQLSGGREREILVEVDQGRLQASGVSVVALADALNKANLNYPAGTVEESFYEYLIRTIGEFKAVKEISKLPVAVDERPLNPREENPQEQGIRPPQEKKTEKRLILLSDVARVKDTMQEQVSISRYNGRDTISLSVIKQAGANTLWVANNVKATLKDLKSTLQAHVKVTVTYDQSQFIRGSIAGVRDAAVQGGFLAFLVLLFFLRKVVPSLIVTLSIPISMLGVFSMMYFSNISLNMISLGGLALGVGMLVDCAIVVIENIYRHIALGKAPQEASVVGTNEVNSALWGSTLTTQAVFFPMIFVVGIAGQLFKELAFAVIASLMISLVVALTLIPILISKEVSKSSSTALRRPAWIHKAQDLLWNGLMSFVRKLGKPSLAVLKYVLTHRMVSLSVMLAVFILSVFMLSRMDWELLPRIDQGQFVIKVNLTPGTRLAITDSIVKKIEKRLFALSEVEDVNISIGSSKEKTSAGQMVETLGSHQAQIMVSLKPLAMHKKTKYTTLQSLLLPF
jgi:HAE1 family hydrophobic/amphiphilic exporter-1